MRGTKKWGISAVHRGQVTVSASEFDASILDGDVGNPVGKCCEKNKGVDSICLLLEEAVTTSNRFSLRIACFHFDGFWMQVFHLAGRSSWGDLHRRLCISGLISWGWSIVVMMRQIWFDYIWLLNWSYWILWPWGLGVKELEEGQKTVYWTIIIIVYVLNECFLFRIPCAYCNRSHCQPWVW